MSIEKINILLVDDHHMVIEGMKSILAQIPTVQVKAAAGDAFEALAALRENAIDIAFVDINLPDISGIELCAKIKKEFPGVHVLGFSNFKQRSYVSEMMKNGASGYLVKSGDKEEIKEAVTSVLQGRMYFNININNAAIDEFNNDEAPTLTRREKEILQMLAEGLTTGEIAKKILTTPYTVDTHYKNLLFKFQVNDMPRLIKVAKKLRIL